MGKVLLLGVGVFCLGLCLNGQHLQEQARIQYYESMLEGKGTTPDRKVAYFDSIVNLLSVVEDVDRACFYKIEKLKLLYSENAYLEAYRTGTEVLDFINQKRELSERDIEHKAYAHLILAKCCSNFSLHDESISNLYSILEYPDNPFVIEAYSHLAFVFMDMNQLEQSRMFNYKALAALAGADSLVVLHSSSKVYNNLAGYHYNQHRLDSALFYLNLSVQYFDYALDISSKAYIYHNMAYIYQLMGEYSMAEDYFEIAIDLSKSDPYRQARYQQNLASLFGKNGDVQKAEVYYRKALQTAEEINDRQVKGNVLIELSRLYYLKGFYKRAWEYMERGVMLKDSVFNNESMEKIAIISQRFDNQRIVLEKELLEKELQLARFAIQRRTLLLSVFIMLIVLISVLTFVQIRKIRRNSALHIERERRAATESARREYASTLDESNRKLASNALLFVRTNEMLSNLRANLKSLSLLKNVAERNEVIREIEFIIHRYSADQDWEEFKFHFEQIHPSFYINLNKVNLKLSNTEQRICALLVLNMTAKEIAQITNRSVRTVESMIYRLRKDLNIPVEVKTVEYLRRFLDRDLERPE